MTTEVIDKRHAHPLLRHVLQTSRRPCRLASPGQEVAAVLVHVYRLSDKSPRASSVACGRPTIAITSCNQFPPQRLRHHGTVPYCSHPLPSDYRSRTGVSPVHKIPLLPTNGGDGCGDCFPLDLREDPLVGARTNWRIV